MKNKFLLFLTILLSTLAVLNVTAQDVRVFPQLGHTGGVYSVSFSPDGKRIISSGMNEFKMWDAETGRELRTLDLDGCNGVVISSVAYSSDGKRIVVGAGSEIIVMDAETGRELRTLYNPGGEEVHSVAWSFDGGKIFSYSPANGNRVWDAETGRILLNFGNDSLPLAYSLDSRRVVCMSFTSTSTSETSDVTTTVWDLETGVKLQTMDEHDGIIYHSAAFSPNGKRIVAGAHDNETIKVWDTETGRTVHTLSGHDDWVLSVAFSPDGRWFISGSADSTIKIWDAETGRIVRILDGHNAVVNSVAFSPDGKQIVSGSDDNTITIWNTETGEELRTLSGYIDSVDSVVYGSDGRRIATGSGNTVKLWDADTGRVVLSLVESNFVSTVAYSVAARRIAASSGNAIKIWDAETGRILRTLFGSSDQIMSIAFSADGRRIISSSYSINGVTCKVWDAETGKELRTIENEMRNFTAFAYSLDGRRIVGGASWDSINVWDTETGRVLLTIEGERFSGIGVPTVIAYSPDGRRIVSGNSWTGINVWDAETGRVLFALPGVKREGVTSSISGLSYSPDGRRIAASLWNTIKIWDADTGRELRTLSLYPNDAASIAYSPDCKRIIAGLSDGTTRVWDAESGTEIVQLISFTDGEWVCFTPDGYYNASPNGDKHLNVRVDNNVYGIDQYRSTFYKPAAVTARLGGNMDTPVMGITTTIQDTVSFEPPIVVIRSPDNGGSLTTGQTELSVSIIDQKQPIKTITVLVNGRQVGSDETGKLTGSRGIKKDYPGLNVLENEHLVEFRFPINLNPGQNHIEVLASNPYSEGRDTVDVTWQPAASQQPEVLPNLYILSIGINRYDDQQWLGNLNYAVNDAKEIIDAFKAQEGKLYRSVNSFLIADDTPILPTRANIIDSFDFLKKAGSRDVVALFIAGHGMNDDGGNFYLMPSDAGFTPDGAIRASQAIPNRDIRAVLDVPGQKLVFIDACNSEGTSGKKARGADNDRLVRELQDKSTVIFTSSRGIELSYEDEKLKHGYFTYAIIQGMKGEADLIKDGKITMKELDAYVSETVPRLSGGLQHPTTSTPDGYVNFNVAKVE